MASNSDVERAQVQMGRLVAWVREGRWHGVRYRVTARTLHRLNLHHTRTLGPMDDGAYLVRCDWCGLSQRKVPLARMSEAIGQASERGRSDA
jgi:hypothetical protein